MPDVSNYPLPTQEAIKQIGLLGDALMRANKGREWLDLNAPSDWRLQMMHIINGRVSSRVRMCRDNENPLALAFRRDKHYRNQSIGEVTWASVFKKLGPLMSNAKAHELGFLEKSHTHREVLISRDIDAIFLDEAWATVLENLEWNSRPAPYPEAKEVEKKPSYEKLFGVGEPDSAILRMAGDLMRSATERR